MEPIQHDDITGVKDKEEGSNSSYESNDQKDSVEKEVVLNGEDENQETDNREDNVSRNQVQAAPSYGTFTRFTIDSILRGEGKIASSSAAQKSSEEFEENQETIEVKIKISDDQSDQNLILTERKGIKRKCEEREGSGAAINRERYPWLQCTRYKPPRLPSKLKTISCLYYPGHADEWEMQSRHAVLVSKIQELQESCCKNTGRLCKNAG